jgi:hypothetical protein
MHKLHLAALALVLAASPSFAVDDKGLSGKGMDDHPGTTGGATVEPTVKPDSGSLSEKQMQDEPGVNNDKTGVTVDPNAVPADGGLAGKAMKGAPAASK